MLEYSKTILEKVAFNEQLFKKEFKKAMTLLMEQEANELSDWCHHKFGNKYLGLHRESKLQRVD